MIDKLQHLTFSMKDVKTDMSVTEFTQTVFKYVKTTQIDLIFQQIIQA